VNAGEAEFRLVERVLDDLVAAAQEQLRASAIQLEDRSVRTYHYKNEYLFWDHCFLAEWRVEAERARVTVRLTYGEPVRLDATPPELELSWRAELFQQGHESRIDRRGGRKLTLAQVQEQGIESLVGGAIREGSCHLPQLSK
jgi:hypothetical protein